ncbi:MAG: hypothetical protein OXC07_00955 [Kistimonas sp.]|nr:hypothetical protein [Kistimonas sp.]
MISQCALGCVEAGQGFHARLALMVPDVMMRFVRGGLHLCRQAVLMAPGRSRSGTACLRFSSYVSRRTLV